jgi:hypothetical protein
LPHTEVDPLALVDARIRLAQSRRAASPRYSEDYWDADDDLVWLRMVRDEVARSGHLRDELRALVASVAVPVPVSVAADDRLAGQLPAPVASERSLIEGAARDPAARDEHAGALAAPVGAGTA